MLSGVQAKICGKVAAGGCARRPHAAAGVGTQAAVEGSKANFFFAPAAVAPFPERPSFACFSGIVSLVSPDQGELSFRRHPAIRLLPLLLHVTLRPDPSDCSGNANFVFLAAHFGYIFCIGLRYRNPSFESSLEASAWDGPGAQWR